MEMIEQNVVFKAGDRFICTKSDDFNNQPSYIEGNEYECIEFKVDTGVGGRGIIKMSTEPWANYVVFADMKHFHNRFSKI